MQSCYLEKLHASMDVYIACRYVSYEYVYPDSRYLSVCMPVYTYKKGQQMTSRSAEPQDPGSLGTVPSFWCISVV